jgi:acyl-CoA thioester hydrolase
MAHRFTCTERVQFSDTDMAGIVHFSNFFRYMERVEHGFFRSLGFSVVDPPTVGEERVGWPRVHASCDYMSPLHFEEEFESEHLIRFWKTDGSLAAEGRITAACVRRDPATGKMKAIEIPQRFRDQIEAAPAELLRRPERR